MSDHPNVVARSLPEANQDVARLAPEAAVISIGAPDGPLPYGFDPNNPLHVRLEFHDVIDEGLSFDETAGVEIHPPRPEHAERICGLAEPCGEANFVYCHCNAGVSRSTATAYILRCIWNGPGCEVDCLEAVVEDRPMAQPNELLVRYADEHLGRDGAMLEALEELDDLLSQRF